MLGAKLASTGFLLYALFACLFYPLHRALCEEDRRMLWGRYYDLYWSLGEAI